LDKDGLGDRFFLKKIGDRLPAASNLLSQVFFCPSSPDQRLMGNLKPLGGRSE
jgi:hypothetical protein